MEDFIKGIPKCELHLHICGNTEPEVVFKLAERNGIKLKYNTPEELRQAYNFKNLEEFLELFNEGTDVIKHEADLYDITYDYFVHAHKDNVVHAELQWSPENFVRTKGMTMEESMNGVTRAMDDAKKNFGITSSMIICCERHNPESNATDVLRKMGPWRKYIVAAGLASAEVPFPPNLFVNHFAECREQNLKISVHAGEEGPADYIYQSLDLLKADRIDHGNAAITDPKLMKRLADEKIPCTMCPLSNLRLNVIKSLADHPIKKFMEAGIIVSVNSDDPSFFRGYINDNYIELQKALNLSREDIITIAKNSFISSYLSEEEKKKGIQLIDQYVKDYDSK